MTDHVSLRPPIEVDGVTYRSGEVCVPRDGHPYVWRVWTNDDRDYGPFRPHGHTRVRINRSMSPTFVPREVADALFEATIEAAHTTIGNQWHLISAINDFLEGQADD